MTKLRDQLQQLTGKKLAKTAVPKKSPPTKKPAKKAQSPKKKRTPKNNSAAIERTCQEYVLNGGDQSKAYRIAFPNSAKWKDASVHQRASKLFADTKVQSRIEALKAQAADIAKNKFNVDAEYVLGRLAEIDRMDFADIFKEDGKELLPIHEWPESWRRYISGFDFSEIWGGTGEERQMIGFLKKIKWPDKVKNLELLGKHVSVNAFREQVGLSDPNGDPVQLITRRIVRPGDVEQ